MAGSSIDVGFQSALKRIIDGLSPAEKEEFRFSTLEDVHAEISKIQKAQEPDRRLRNLPRIKAFLEGMEQFGKIIEVFLNVSDIVAFVWGPVKFLLQIASTWVESLDILLNAYEEISENIPQLLAYQQLFEKNPHMRRVLELMYGDILEFHRHALKIFKRSAWKQFFRSSWKTFNTRFQCILSNLSRHRNLIESQASLVEYEQSKLARLAAQNSFEEIAKSEKDRRFIAVIEKVHPPNSLNDHEQAVEARQEHPGTGRWILGAGQLRQWMDPLATDVPVLWVNGIPGAGKTIIAALIIEEMKEIDAVTVLYFYCKYSDGQKNSLTAALRSILAQMVQQNEEVLSFVYDKCASSSEATLESPTLLKELVEISLKSCGKACIILDGLDECAADEENRITAWLLKMLQSVNKDDPGSLRGLLISQRDAALERLLKSIPVISLDTQEHQKDIGAYCSSWSPRMKEKFDLPTAAAGQIAASVAAQAEGLFLFAKLVMTNLYEQTSRRRLDAELEPDCFPSGLEAAYERIAHRVFNNPIKAEREDAQEILSWVICARRPLKWYEFQGGIFSIDTGSQTVDFEDRRLRVTGRDLCGSLIEMRPGNTIELVHRTAKSYLIATGRISPGSEALRIAAFCLQYLNFRCFDANLTEGEVQEYFRNAYYSFEDYAIAHWIDHLASCTPEMLPHDPRPHQHLAKQVELFLAKHGFDQPKDFSILANKQLQTLKHLDPSQRLDCVAQLVHQNKSAGSYLDLEAQLYRRRTIYEKLIADLDPDSDITSLIESFNGCNSFKCPKLFCERFYDGFVDGGRRNEHLNQHDRPFRCAFEGCVYSKLGYGTMKDLKRHLKKSHPTDEDAHWTFPLPKRLKEPDIFSAAEAGDLETVRRSVEELGISANSGKSGPVYQGGMTPLCMAALHNRVEVVKYLLGQGVDVNLRLKKNKIYRHDTALGIAVRLGHTVIAELLFKNGASIGMTTAREATLKEAVEVGSLSMVKLLLDKDACDFEFIHDLGPPIELAAKNSYADILRVLLSTNPGRRTNHGRRISGDELLYTAISNGYEDASRVLLENGDFPLDPGRAFRALQLALSKAGEDPDRGMLGVLSQCGILELKTSSGNTALHWAGAEGDVTITRALLEYGLRIDETNDDGETTLHLVCRGVPLKFPRRRMNPSTSLKADYYAVFQLLLGKGADAKMKDSYGQTLLHWAGSRGDVTMTRALLGNGLRVDETNDDGETTLHLACRGVPLEPPGRRTDPSTFLKADYYAVIRLLLEKGANAKIQDSHGNTPLGRIEGGRDNDENIARAWTGGR